MIMARLSTLGMVLVIATLTVVATVAPANTAVFTFSNANALLINDGAAATPYPSNIVVSDVTGVVTHVTVRLIGVTHALPEDVDALLVSPVASRL